MGGEVIVLLSTETVEETSHSCPTLRSYWERAGQRAGQRVREKERKRENKTLSHTHKERQRGRMSDGYIEVFDRYVEVIK